MIERTDQTEQKHHGINITGDGHENKTKRDDVQERAKTLTQQNHWKTNLFSEQAELL